MCQTATISDKIIKIGTRSYRQNLESIGNNYISTRNLAALNHDLDKLYELIYTQFSTITPEDYKIFGAQLQQLVKTIKDLHTTCKKAPLSMGLKDETIALGRNYSALLELNNDIKNFKVKSYNDTDLSALLKQASSSIQAISL